MQLPVLNMFKKRETYDLNRNQQMLMQFGGFDRRPEAPEGTWYDQTNMGTWNYPTLSTRRHRMRVSINSTPITATSGLSGDEALITVKGTDVIYNGYTVHMAGLISDDPDMCPKQLVRMGSYLLIWPDKAYLNVHKRSEKGSMENTFNNTGKTGDDVKVHVALCDVNGTNLEKAPTTSAVAPLDPSDGDYWVDTSNVEVPVLKQWNEGLGYWVQIPTTYVKISASYTENGVTHKISDGFSQWDGITVEGIGRKDSVYESSRMLSVLNTAHVIHAIGDGYIVVDGIVSGARAWTTGEGCIIKRSVPDMDYVTECGNRIWGCKYNVTDAKTVNEIYASALGDFKNWNRFMGLATDSYVAGRGAGGVFTGACTYQGHPLFFRENYIEKVYPSASGAHQIVTTEARGVQDGCWRSLAIGNETLFYKSRSGVCAYTGSMPYSVSDALGRDFYEDARAGASNGMYYISMKNTGDDTWHFFVYDIARNVWNREDDTVAMMFCEFQGRIHYIDENDFIDGVPKVKRYYSQGANVDTTAIPWSVTSNVIGLNLAENEYVTRFVIRCETLGEVRLEVRYDEETETVDGETVEKWIDKGRKTMSGLGSFVLPVAPRRCDHLRIRLSGNKQCKIYSITKYVAAGSDVMW